MASVVAPARALYGDANSHARALSRCVNNPRLAPTQTKPSSPVVVGGTSAAASLLIHPLILHPSRPEIFRDCRRQLFVFAVVFV
jgi:hypothetical protein